MLKRFQQITNSVVQFVNSLSGVNRKTLDAFVPRKMRTTLFEQAKYCTKTGLVVGPLGQISMRLSADKLLVTTSGTSFSRISDQDLILVSFTGEGGTTAEDSIQNLDWYRAVFQNKEAKAVLLCQPAAALSLASNPVELNTEWMQDAPGVIGQIGFAEQDQAGDHAFATSHQVILIKGKGMLSWGSSLEEAIGRAEVAERWCQVAINFSKLESE
ncbi:MAG: class II aldolase/adducin family protein [Chloroflexota bacterium]